MNSILLAALFTLQPGYNNLGIAGEVVAVEAATSNAAETVTLKAVSEYTIYTNATEEVVRYEPAWALTYTNFDGEAAIETNVVGYLDYNDFKTNGVSKILTGPTRFDLPITNEVVVATIASDTFAVTNDIAELTTADHFGSVATNAFLFGGAVIVDGITDAGQVKIVVR